ncbi:MAG: cob(I)yrinic acid a,c-diamide adenosyltransferase [DPANN group archaeon]|nr:cob(I)yrinic acid a,c-diamide adenosyltransferase [DPANN group archaeon]
MAEFGHCDTTKAFTGKGDFGETSIITGERLSKSAVRIEAIGSVDELNSFIGLCRAENGHDDFDNLLETIQHKLFVVGAELAHKSEKIEIKTGIVTNDTALLETELQLHNKNLELLKNFILPRGTKLSSYLHASRTICRRAERRVVALSKIEKINPEVVRYLNRLSSLLFVLARTANSRDGVKEKKWQN